MEFIISDKSFIKTRRRELKADLGLHPDDPKAACHVFNMVSFCAKVPPFSFVALKDLRAVKNGKGQQLLYTVGENEAKSSSAIVGIAYSAYPCALIDPCICHPIQDNFKSNGGR